MIKKLLLFPFIISSLIIGQSYVLNFDGSNDYLSVAASDNASTKLTASSEFTMSAWVFIEGADRQQIIYNDEFEVLIALVQDGFNRHTQCNKISVMQAHEHTYFRIYFHCTTKKRFQLHIDIGRWKHSTVSKACRHLVLEACGFNLRMDATNKKLLSKIGTSRRCSQSIGVSFEHAFFY